MKISQYEFDSKAINDNRRQSAGIYAQAAALAEKIVKESCQAMNLSFAFPVDIDAVAKYNEISVELGSLNQHDPQFSRVLAIMSRQNESISLTVDNRISYKTRRYATANAIARCMLRNQESVFTSSYAIPLIPQSLEEISADMIALFMLMPTTLFKDEFLHYLENTDNRPLDVDEWLSYLSDTTQVSPFNLAIGYQQMKMVLCYEHQNDLREKAMKDISDDSDPYGLIFA